MKVARLLIFFIELWLYNVIHVQAQPFFGAQQVFSHNDYAQPVPFYAAYALGVGYIEADIFLKDQMLLVAHAKSDLDTARTLESMYLNPLKDRVTENRNKAYPGKHQTLCLMIDIKSESISTLTRLVHVFSKYPSLVHAKGLRIVISGNMPDADQWNQFPAYVYFDGRPDNSYTKAQWKRIAFVSDDFKKYSTWTGDESIAPQDADKIKNLLTAVHQRHKNFRFWATPDKKNVWNFLIQSGVDIFGTDTVSELVRFLHDQQ